MGAPLGTSVTGNITSVVDNGDETSAATTDQNLDDSVDRFVPGSLTSGGLDFSVTANTNGANFTLRFNRRTSRLRGKLFYRLTQQAVAVGPVPHSDIRGGTDEQPESIG